MVLQLGSTLAMDDIKEGDDIYFECKIQSNPSWRRLTWLHNVSTPVPGWRCRTLDAFQCFRKYCPCLPFPHPSVPFNLMTMMLNSFAIALRTLSSGALGALFKRPCSLLVVTGITGHYCVRSRSSHHSAQLIPIPSHCLWLLDIPSEQISDEFQHMSQSITYPFALYHRALPELAKPFLPKSKHNDTRAKVRPIAQQPQLQLKFA